MGYWHRSCHPPFPRVPTDWRWARTGGQEIRLRLPKTQNAEEQENSLRLRVLPIDPNYASLATTTVISVVTSLCSRTGTLYSPNCLMGSSNCTLRRSMV